MIKKTWIIACFAIILWQGCYYDNKEDLYQFFDTASCDTTNISYSTHVVEVMGQYCLSCHSNALSSGNVNLEGYNNLRLYAENGSLYGSITHATGYSPMPSAGEVIPQCDQDKVKAWMDAGMPNN